MTPSPAALHLVDFGRLLACDAAVCIPDDAPAAQTAEAPPALDTARLIAEAVEQGRAEGRLQAVAEHEAALAAERVRASQMLADERARWSTDEGDRLGACLAVGLGCIETRVADSVASILRPWLTAARHAQAIEDLREALATLLARGSRPVLRVEGPADLLAALRDRLGPGTETIAYVETPGVDLRVVGDHTTIETTLQPWADRLGEAFP